MSTFADGYSRYLTNYFNYINRSRTFRKYFRNSIISLTDPNFMSKKLIDNMADFPKYPYFMNAFVRTDSINLIKIYNSSMDNTSNLLESMVGASELSKKGLYDVIPSSTDTFLAELNFQFAYTSGPIDLYNYELVVRSFITEYQYRNFFSDLYTPLFHSTDQIDGETAGLEDKSFLYQYMLYSSLYNIVSILHNVYPKLLMYLTYMNSSGSKSDRIDQRTMLDGYGGELDSLGNVIPYGGFKAFVTRYSSYMSEDLAGIIGKSMYDFQNISGTMMQDLVTVISTKLNSVTVGLYNSFDDFYTPIKSLSPVNFLSNNVSQHLNALISADIVTKIYNDDTIIDQNAMSIETQYEDDEYSLYMEKITESQLKNYLFLCFLYKFWPIKFLNVLQLSIKEYTEIVIKNSNDKMLSQIDYGDLFEYFTTNYVDYVTLNSFLCTYLTPTANIVTYGAGTHAKFTFTPGVAEVVCSNLDSYNSVNVHDYIYADGDDRSVSVHVMSKVLGTLKLITDNEYLGTISTANVDAYRYTFTPPSYIYDVSLNCQVAEFACINYYIYVLEEYFKSTSYNTFIEELTEDIFTYLRNNGHIDYTFDWYEYHDVIDVYFKVYLRWKLLDQSKRCSLSNFSNARYLFSNNSSIVYCADLAASNFISDGDYIFAEYDTLETANQVISHGMLGSDYVLNLASPYAGQSPEDGLYSTAYVFTSTDVPLFNNVTANFANKLYPKLVMNATSDPNYDIDIIIPTDTDLANYFNSFSTSQSFIRSMHQFSENMVLSTITRETIYSVLSNFV